MADLHLSINGKEQVVGDLDPTTPLLWVLRDSLGLTGTKYGCGGGFCGACTVHVNGAPIRSCSVPAITMEGKAITTIEGIASEDGTLHALQAAWIEHDVPQCGYCQAGQIMSAAALLESNPSPTDDDINAAMAGNICRCGCYNRITDAIHTAAANTTEDTGGAA
jgi:isoquinoline 1-oxidoreductase alpha subunit